jgi:hypothetical protein
MHILFFITLFIIFLVFVLRITKKHYSKSHEQTDCENAIDFIQNYKLDPKEKIAMDVSSAILSDTIARKNLRRLIAAEIKARVLDSALDPTAFPSGDDWAYEKSKSELENEKKKIEAELTKIEVEENERQKLLQEVRTILQKENISEEWIANKPQLFLSYLQYQGFQQAPHFARKHYAKLNDYCLSEIKYFLKNRNNVINEHNKVMDWKKTQQNFLNKK